MEGIMSDGGFLAQRSFSPGSFGVAVAVNGGFMALLLTLAAGVATVMPDDDKPLINPFTLPPPPPMPSTEQVKKKAEPVKNTPVDKFTAPPVVNTPPQGTNKGFADPAGDIIIPTGPSGSGPETIIEPLVIPPPVPVVIKAPAFIDPRFKSQFQPDYPAGRIRAEQEGVAVVRVLIGVDGRVKAVESVSADHEDFLRETREHALKKWRFKPATEGGTPVESWKQMTVRFQFPE
jgi:periplasmic protein TonB